MSIQSTEPYVGRLVCDGDDNLLADEGESRGAAVYYDIESNSYLFVKDGELSHNARHHTGFVFIVPTKPGDPHHE